MIIKTKLSQSDFTNVSIVMLYNRIFVKVLTTIGSIMLLLLLFIAIVSPQNANFSNLVGPCICIGLLPLSTYFYSKKNFNSNPTISENMEYDFSKEFLSIKGESFNSQIKWTKVYQVTKKKNWILIWQNKQMANGIPRRDIWDGEIADLKDILDANKVKNNL